ncbi:SigE family RNA polymerase sigma factor [Nakamurella silvestris]|nr:SigE family RNA polymerase sigma factor [Nakamurella silvestris]
MKIRRPSPLPKPGQDPAPRPQAGSQSDASCARPADFERFLDAHLTGLLKYARVLTHNRDDAHDAVTDCLIKVQPQWARIATLEQPLAYVRKVLVNTVISDHRRWSKRMICLTVSGELPEVEGQDHSSDIDHLDHLGRLLLTLSSRQRAMIVMRYYLDLTDVEIAAQLGCSQATVRATICRALGSLRAGRSQGRQQLAFA